MLDKTKNREGDRIGQFVLVTIIILIAIIIWMAREKNPLRELQTQVRVDDKKTLSISSQIPDIYRGHDENEENNTEDDVLKGNKEAQSKEPQIEIFVENIALVVQQSAWDNELYSSILIGQIILKKKSKNSLLSESPYYNLFHLKGDYHGNTVQMLLPSAYEDGFESVNFRVYSSYQESIEDYLDSLKNQVSDEIFSYDELSKNSSGNYEEIIALKSSESELSKEYLNDLASIIVDYNLTIYDQSPEKEISTTEQPITTSVSETTVKSDAKQVKIKSRKWLNQPINQILGEIPIERPNWNRLITEGR